MDQHAAESHREFRITRSLDASCERAFDLWTVPEQFAFWFGSDLVVHDVVLEARPGGEWRATMSALDGVEVPFGGHFLEVNRPSRLVMSFEIFHQGSGKEEDFQRLTVTFAPKGSGCEMTLHHAGRMSPETVDAMKDGLQSFLDRMPELLSRTP